MSKIPQLLGTRRISYDLIIYFEGRHSLAPHESFGRVLVIVVLILVLVFFADDLAEKIVSALVNVIVGCDLLLVDRLFRNKNYFVGNLNKFIFLFLLVTIFTNIVKGESIKKARQFHKL